MRELIRAGRRYTGRPNRAALENQFYSNADPRTQHTRNFTVLQGNMHNNFLFLDTLKCRAGADAAPINSPGLGAIMQMLIFLFS